LSELLCGHLRLTGSLPPSVGSRLFGTVESAVDEQTGQHLWITRIDQGLLVTSYAMSEFMSGANGLRNIRHPDLVRISVVDREETFALVGFEALPGGIVLEDVIAREGPMPVVRALDVGAKLLRGLSCLHRNSAIHGLLSPRTVVWWERECLGWQYGLASHLPEVAIAQRARRHGDVELFAPELRDGQLIPPTDLFAWAVTVCQLLTGHGPSEAVGEIIDGGAVEVLPEAVRTLFRECLHTDPLMRPNDATRVEPRFEEASLTEASTMTVLPMEGTPPPPPAPLERERPPTTVSMNDGVLAELIDDDDVKSEPEPVRPAPRSTGGRRRPEPTAKLAALAQGAGAGESLSNLLTPQVGDGPGAASSSPDLERLASALADEPGLRDLDDGPELGLDGRAGTDAGGHHEPDGLELGGPDALPPPSVARPREDAASATARGDSRRRSAGVGPGPHGPRPGIMGGAFVAVSGAVVLLSLLHVIGERGGITALLPEQRHDSGETGESQVATGTGTGTGTELILDEQAGDEDEGGAASLPSPPEPCPTGMVAISDAVCIDAGEYPGLRRIPKVDVSVRQAATACEGRGGRLCSLEEWRSACKGRGGAPFPYGSAVEHDACNTASIAGFPQEHGASGSRRRCVSAMGAYDMVGNVGEWVAEGIAAGGDSTTPAAVAKCSATGRPPKGFSGPNLGFRCCADR